MYAYLVRMEMSWNSSRPSLTSRQSAEGWERARLPSPWPPLPYCLPLLQQCITLHSSYVYSDQIYHYPAKSLSSMLQHSLPNNNNSSKLIIIWRMGCHKNCEQPILWIICVMAESEQRLKRKYIILLFTNKYILNDNLMGWANSVMRGKL